MVQPMTSLNHNQTENYLKLTEHSLATVRPWFKSPKTWCCKFEPESKPLVWGLDLEKWPNLNLLVGSGSDISTVADSQSLLIFETKYLDGDNNPEVYLRLEYISLDANDKICMSRLFDIDEIRFWPPEIWPYPQFSTKNHRKITNRLLSLNRVCVHRKTI